MRTFAGVMIGSFAAAVCTVTLAAQTPPTSGPRITQEHGSSLYAAYCATCHGSSARGDGPLAEVLKRRPPDLTEIAKRNNGVFPRDLMVKVVDGRQPVRGHGGPDMPVWGDAFKRAIDVGGEEAIKVRIEAIVDYLEMIQKRLVN